MSVPQSKRKPHKWRKIFSSSIVNRSAWADLSNISIRKAQSFLQGGETGCMCSLDQGTALHYGLPKELETDRERTVTGQSRGLGPGISP